MKTAKTCSPQLPALPGVYLFKDKNNQIIYIGKAKNLYKRVQSYFRNQKTDWKVAQLIEEHDMVDHIVTHSESDALLLEAQLISDYKPKFNVLLKSGQPFVYILFTQTEGQLPLMQVVRNKNKKGSYFGPFLHKTDARAVADYLVRTFQLKYCNKTIENGCLDYHLGNCAGTCRKNFDTSAYRMRFELAQDVLKEKDTVFLKKLAQQIAANNAALEFEKAAALSSYIKNFEVIFATIKAKYHDKKYALEVEQAVVAPVVQEDTLPALEELQKLLGLAKLPRTIDCFDISHFQSTHIVGSCIRFTDGKKDPKNFRRFLIKSLKQQNDYAALQEIVLRRYRDRTELPDVIFIDGGKGQRNAIKQFFPEVICVSLAKREELLITDTHPEGVPLDLQTPMGRLMIALRDYAHHFAVSYHRLRRKSNVKMEKNNKLL